MTGVTRRPAEGRRRRAEPTLVRALYEAGATERSIAVQLRVPQAAVADALAASGVERRRSGRPRPLTGEQLRQLVESGATQSSLAVALNVSHATVSLWLAEIGIGDPDPRIDRTELRTLYVDQQLTTREVAAYFGVSKHRVLRELALADIPRRSQHTRRPRGPRASVTAEKLVELYVERGLTLAQVQAELGVSEDYLRRRLRDFGIAKRPGTFAPRSSTPKLTAARAGTLYTSGRNMAEVALELGISASQVAIILAEAGIPVRRPGARPMATNHEPTRRVLEQLYQDPDIRSTLRSWNIPVQEPDHWDRPSPFEAIAPDPLPRDLLHRLYSEIGLTIHHISILCGVGTGGVKAQLQRNGINLRPSGPSPWSRRQTHR